MILPGLGFVSESNRLAMSQERWCAMTEHTYTPPDIARRYGVKWAKVLSWINSGELAAVNVATVTTGRPRWRITREALESFELRRSAIPQVKPQRRRRRRLEGIKEYF